MVNSTMRDPTVEQRTLEWAETATWFREHVDDLDPLMPHEMGGTDQWDVSDSSGDRVGLAVVEPDHPSDVAGTDETVAWVHRIGVADDHQGEGFGRELLECIHEEYGVIKLEIDSRKPANGFYEALGMELTEEKYAVMNDGTEGTMNVWLLR